MVSILFFAVFKNSIRIIYLWDRRQPELVTDALKESDKISIGINTCSKNCNLLEAINLALAVFDKHQIDRDLKHTGQAIIILSPGSGYFEVFLNSILAFSPSWHLHHFAG